MCPAHWRMVPSEIKVWINNSYKAGDKSGNKKACIEALTVVYKLEQSKRDSIREELANEPSQKAEKS